VQGSELKVFASLVDSKNRLKFGTAGLRGAMGAGYNCMNDLVVLQTSQGLLKYICDSCGIDNHSIKAQVNNIFSNYSITFTANVS
jgi:phosphomannomutase